ncbi:MAG: hypothetical protein WCJ42_09385 [Actinomycetes bacterium]
MDNDVSTDMTGTNRQGRKRRHLIWGVVIALVLIAGITGGMLQHLRTGRAGAVIIDCVQNCG